MIEPESHLPLGDDERAADASRPAVFEVKPAPTAPVEDEPRPAPPGMDTLIVLPVRDMVLFPGTVFPIALGRGVSIAAAQQAVREEK